MNWMGGARSRVKFQDERKIQQEFFDRKRLGNFQARSSRGKESKRRKVSQDLMALQTVSQAHSHTPSVTAKEQKTIKKLDLDKFQSCTRRIGDVNLGPCSPNTAPSKLLLNDGKQENTATSKFSTPHNNRQQNSAFLYPGVCGKAFSKSNSDSSGDHSKIENEAFQQKGLISSTTNAQLPRGGVKQETPSFSFSRRKNNDVEKFNKGGHRGVFDPFVSEDFQTTPLAHYQQKKKSSGTNLQGFSKVTESVKPSGKAAPLSAFHDNFTVEKNVKKNRKESPFEKPQTVKSELNFHGTKAPLFPGFGQSEEKKQKRKRSPLDHGRKPRSRKQSPFTGMGMISSEPCKKANTADANDACNYFSFQNDLIKRTRKCYTMSSTPMTEQEHIPKFDDRMMSNVHHSSDSSSYISPIFIKKQLHKRTKLPADKEFQYRPHLMVGKDAAECPVTQTPWKEEGILGSVDQNGGSYLSNETSRITASPIQYWATKITDSSLPTEACFETPRSMLGHVYTEKNHIYESPSSRERASDTWLSHEQLARSERHAAGTLFSNEKFGSFNKSFNKSPMDETRFGNHATETWSSHEKFGTFSKSFNNSPMDGTRSGNHATDTWSSHEKFGSFKKSSNKSTMDETEGVTGTSFPDLPESLTTVSSIARYRKQISPFSSECVEESSLTIVSHSGNNNGVIPGSRPGSASKNESSKYEHSSEGREYCTVQNGSKIKNESSKYDPLSSTGQHDLHQRIIKPETATVGSHQKPNSYPTQAIHIPNSNHTLSIQIPKPNFISLEDDFEYKPPKEKKWQVPKPTISSDIMRMYSQKTGTRTSDGHGGSLSSPSSHYGEEKQKGYAGSGNCAGSPRLADEFPDHLQYPTNECKEYQSRNNSCIEVEETRNCTRSGHKSSPICSPMYKARKHGMQDVLQEMYQLEQQDSEFPDTDIVTTTIQEQIATRPPLDKKSSESFEADTFLQCEEKQMEADIESYIESLQSAQDKTCDADGKSANSSQDSELDDSLDFNQELPKEDTSSRSSNIRKSAAQAGSLSLASPIYDPEKELGVSIDKKVPGNVAAEPIASVPDNKTPEIVPDNVETVEVVPKESVNEVSVDAMQTDGVNLERSVDSIVLKNGSLRDLRTVNSGKEKNRTVEELQCERMVKANGLEQSLEDKAIASDNRSYAPASDIIVESIEDNANSCADHSSNNKPEERRLEHGGTGMVDKTCKINIEKVDAKSEQFLKSEQVKTEAYFKSGTFFKSEMVNVGTSAVSGGDSHVGNMGTVVNAAYSSVEKVWEGTDRQHSRYFFPKQPSCNKQNQNHSHTNDNSTRVTKHGPSLSSNNSNKKFQIKSCSNLSSSKTLTPGFTEDKAIQCQFNDELNEQISSNVHQYTQTEVPSFLNASIFTQTEVPAHMDASTYTKTEVPLFLNASTDTQTEVPAFVDASTSPLPPTSSAITTVSHVGHVTPTNKQAYPAVSQPEPFSDVAESVAMSERKAIWPKGFQKTKPSSTYSASSQSEQLSEFAESFAMSEGKATAKPSIPSLTHLAADSMKFRYHGSYKQTVARYQTSQTNSSSMDLASSVESYLHKRALLIDSLLAQGSQSQDSLPLSDSGNEP